MSSFDVNKFDVNGAELRLFAETDSTNTQAKIIARSGFEKPIVLIADRQTAGRGRLGRSFYSPDETGLYMSYMYKPQASVADSVAVTSAAAVAVVRAVTELTDLKPLIKWVNDIFINGKKVCGILTEAVTDKQGDACVIIGIGINISTADFPDDIKSVAGSLGKALSREQLATAVVKHLQELINGLRNRTFLADYKKYSAVLGCEVVYIMHDVEHKATAVDIDNNGGLVVEDENGKRTTLSTGEISVRIEKPLE